MQRILILCIVVYILPNGKIARCNNDGRTYIGNSNNQLVGLANYSEVQPLISSSVHTEIITSTDTIYVGRLSEGTPYTKYNKLNLSSKTSCNALYITLNINCPSYLVYLTNSEYSYARLYCGIFSSVDAPSGDSPKQYYTLINLPYVHNQTQSYTKTISLSCIAGNPSSLYILNSNYQSSINGHTDILNISDVYYGVYFECFYQSSTYINMPSCTLTATAYNYYI